jgi:hypothetical protein
VRPPPQITHGRSGKGNGFVNSDCAILDALDQTGLNPHRLGPDAEGSEEDCPQNQQILGSHNLEYVYA